MKYAQVRLKQGREKSCKAYHPWVFSGAVDTIDPVLLTGDIADVVSAEGDFLGRGFFNKTSSITIQIASFQPVSIDKDFFLTKIEEAIRVRKELVLSSNAMRIMHGSGDFVPGLIIDQYDRFLSVQFLSSALVNRKQMIVDALVSRINPKGIYDRSDSGLKEEEGIEYTGGVVYGEAPHDRLYITEDGIEYPVLIKSGQKTGFYLDLRGTRRLVRQFACAKSVLNLFCYTGGITICALMAGAQSVTSVDSSKQALDVLNSELSRLSLLSRHTTVCSDVFNYIRKSKEQYDLVVVDPPPLCPRKANIQKASRAYKDLNLHAIRVAKKYGFIVTLCCSHHISIDLFQKIIFASAKDAGRNVRIVKIICQEPDHPVNIFHPETEYFKGFLLAVM